MSIKIRKAKKTDFKRIIRLIKELAEFEKLDPPDRKAEDRLLKDAFGKNPAFKVIVALHDKEIAGYAFLLLLFIRIFPLLRAKHYTLKIFSLLQSKRRLATMKTFFQRAHHKSAQEKRKMRQNGMVCA